MFKLEASKYAGEMPGIRWQGEKLCASQFGDSEFLAACEGIGRFSRKTLLKIFNAYIDNRMAMTGNRRSGEPNWHHPVGVALIDLLEFGNKDPESIIIDLMHDVKEDSPLFQGHKSIKGEFEEFSPFDMLAQRYGSKVAKAIMSLSKPQRPMPKAEMDEGMNERYLTFAYNRVINLYPEVRILSARTKTCDRTFNLRTEKNPEKLGENLVETARYVFPIASFAGENYEAALREEFKDKSNVLTAEQRSKVASVVKFTLD